MMRTELTAPSNVKFIKMVQAYVKELAEVAGLSERDANLLVLAIQEACVNSIEYGNYDRDEQDLIKVTGEVNSTTLTLAVLDRGMPFDPTLAVPYPAGEPAECRDASLHGLGLHLIRQAVDEMRWINHGREGKELRLVKYIASAETTLEPAPAPGDAEGDADGARRDPRPGRYTIRLMQDEDALRVSQCFFRTFGYSYDEDLYMPERLIRLNRKKKFISVVAVDDRTGEVAGHVALVQGDIPAIGEYTHLAVAPAHRGRQLRKRMGDFLAEHVRRSGVIGLTGLAVTTHVLSQEASEQRGFSVCGVSLGYGSRYRFKKLKAPSGDGSSAEASVPCDSQKESFVCYFRYLASPEKAFVYAPRHHVNILRRVYGHLKAPVHFLTPRRADGPSQVDVSYWRQEQTGDIQVRRAGRDTIPEIRRALCDLCELAGAEIVHLHLPLAQPGVAEVCAAAEELGFFFSGLAPRHAPDGDVLQLQFLNVDLDLRRIMVFSDFGKQLLEYVLAEMERVGCTRCGSRRLPQ